MPIFTADHAPLVEYLRKLGVLGKSDVPVTNLILVSGLQYVRNIADAANPFITLWGLLFTALAILWTRGSFR